ncbi:MAG: 4Fe-4S dicluster domain-containing protein [Chitinophagaceae bacterium]|nr:4Fe-4S dicluster domain-containing protein [Chitinophagaceae bacterium]
MALKEAGAEALELMDRNALKSVEHLPGLPDFFQHLPPDAAALLCEFQAENKAELEKALAKAMLVCNRLELLHPAEFTAREKNRLFYWKIRKGLFPSVGAVRNRGTTVILEDIAFPVEHLADALIDLKQLFQKFGYDNAIIFGHAKEGNIHFVITQLLDKDAEVKRYDAFMREVVSLVLEKYQGALKAEHGTGRNMAPFVEAEWGGVAYRIMSELKNTVDPLNLLNPGVIINSDKEAHIKDLKQMPEVEHEVDKCIECGFCEHHCPSKDVTLTPRQRIQVRRHLKQMEVSGESREYRQLVNEFQYSGLDTCAVDGLCQTDCPVGINTGDLVKRLRSEQHGKFSKGVAEMLSHQFKLVERLLKGLLFLGNFMNTVFGKRFMPRLTSGIKKVIPSMPLWWNELGKPPGQLYQHPDNPQYVYLSACIQRMMGNDMEKGSVQQAMLEACKNAGLSMLLPKDLSGHCCGQAFSSKGYFDAAYIRQRALIDALWKWTKEGKLPVVCDFSSCTYTLLKAGSHLEESYREKLSKLIIYDSIQFLKEIVLPELPAIEKKTKVVLHPGCAASKMELAGAMKELAAQCAENVVIPADAGCCGMAGDRGFLFPELTKGATAKELNEAAENSADGYYASAKTCEMALTHFSGKPYRHIVYLVNEATERT